MCVNVHTLYQTAESDEIVLLTMTTAGIQNSDDAIDFDSIEKAN